MPEGEGALAAAAAAATLLGKRGVVEGCEQEGEGVGAGKRFRGLVWSGVDGGLVVRRG
jgi:hypothetical protein